MAALRRDLKMSTTAAAMTRSVAAAEDVATPLATNAAAMRGMGFRKLQMIHRGAASAHGPRVRAWSTARVRVTKVTDVAFWFANLSEVF